MANKSYLLYDKENDEFIPVKLVDAGDGTWRMAVEIEGASFGDVSIGDVEIVLLPLDTFAAAAAAAGKGVLIQGMDGAARVNAIMGPNGSIATKRLTLMIDPCETVTAENVTGTTDVSGIAVSTAHRGQGANSIEFDKGGTTQAFARIIRTIAAVNARDWARHSFVDHWLFINTGDLAGITSIHIGLGTDVSNYWHWDVLAADLAEGWNHLHLPLGAIDGETGVGANWAAITFWMLYVTLGDASKTLTNMRIDSIVLERADAVSVRDIRGDGFTQTVDINDISKGAQTNDVDVAITGMLSAATAVGTGATVGNTSTNVLAANAARKFAVFVNDSDEEIYLGLGAAAVMNAGIRLNSNGGCYEINILNMCTGIIYAICTSGGKNLTVMEG